MESEAVVEETAGKVLEETHEPSASGLDMVALVPEFVPSSTGGAPLTERVGWAIPGAGGAPLTGSVDLECGAHAHFVFEAESLGGVAKSGNPSFFLLGMPPSSQSNGCASAETEAVGHQAHHGGESCAPSRRERQGKYHSV
jgi:hypothetical protein